MKYPYTCTICNAHWEATSQNFPESHLASDEHRHNKALADRTDLLATLDETQRTLNKIKTSSAFPSIPEQHQSRIVDVLDQIAAAIQKAESE